MRSSFYIFTSILTLVSSQAFAQTPEVPPLAPVVTPTTIATPAPIPAPAPVLHPVVAAPAVIVPSSPAQVEFSFAPVVKKVAPAVVNIFGKQHVQVQTPVSPFANDPFFKQFFGQQFGFEQPRERIVSSLGSGVLVSSDGTVVTSLHVVKNSEQINVVLADKREFTAQLVKADPHSDLAILKIAPKGSLLPFIPLRDSDTLEVGDLVLAIGNPFGVGQTVTHGIVSALARQARGVGDYSFFIQTDAAVNPGNSGGALVDLQGRLVGINTAIYSTSGGSNGIGFAIPANMVQAVLSGKVQNKIVIQPWFGIVAQNLTAEMVQSMGLESAKGALVKSVETVSPAAQAGVLPGDVIVGVDGKAVDDAQQLGFREATSAIGHNIALLVQRGKKKIALTLTPQELVTPKASTVKITGNNPLSGASVAEITPEITGQLGLKPDVRGVVVVEGNSRVLPGDVLISVNSVSVTGVEQLQKLFAVPSRVWEVSFNRNGSVTTLTVIR